MKPIHIESISYVHQRYETLGDYYDDEKGTQIKVTDMGAEDYEFLIALHEMVEQYLCKNRGIREEDITKFDKMFEAERDAEKWTTEEPGDDPRAPYKKEHFFSTNIERLMAEQLGVNWQIYEKFCQEYETRY
jgi:hypothetical protein